MNTWSPLWSGIVDSSLWEEDGDVVKVFMTMLAVKDSDHVCRLDAYRIAKKCNFKQQDGSVDEVKVLDILKVLASPDKRRQTKQEFNGKRIRAVEDGWLVLNGEKYRKLVAEEMQKSRWRRAQSAKRKRTKEKLSGAPLPGELEHESAVERGASEADTDRIVTKHLPKAARE